MSEMNESVPMGNEALPPEGNPSAEKPQDQQLSEGLFTQEQVDKFIAGESKKAIDKLLKENGLSNEEEFKSKMEDFRKWQDGQKTEMEKALEEKQAAETALQELKLQLDSERKKAEAFSKGIPSELLPQYIALADSCHEEGSDFATDLGKALEKFPIKTDGPAYGVPGKTNPPGGAMSMMAKALGLR